MSDMPVLYSFRRCPYAIRARLAIAQSAMPVLLREVVLKAKPSEMLASSPKGTVPVLVLSDGQVIDESLDIMHWALRQSDPDHWLPEQGSPEAEQCSALITDNDGPFKHYLDRYKYADRYPEQAAEFYREKAREYLKPLEQRLCSHRYLLGEQISLADAALWPFIRQFAHVDKAWFDQVELPGLQRWLDAFLTSPLFISVMKKYPAWQSGEAAVEFPEN